MTEQAQKYLFDILQAIELIELFSSDIVDFSDYQKDLKTKSAVERQLGIIGAAVNQFRKVAQDTALSHTRQIIDFRNRLIHSYDAIDDAIVWAILKTYIPILRSEVKRALEKKDV